LYALPLCFIVPHPATTLFPYTTLFRSRRNCYRSISSRRTRWTLCSWRQGSLSVFGDHEYCPSTRSWGLHVGCCFATAKRIWWIRSEEHTSELQSRFDLVCRLLLEKKK